MKCSVQQPLEGGVRNQSWSRSLTRERWVIYEIRVHAHSEYIIMCSGVARGGQGGGGICPRAPPGGGRQNHAKEFF